MSIRPLKAILLMAVVIGGVLTYLADTKHQELLTEHRRLEEKFLSLPLEDPSKMHVRALETGEELHFAWRVYSPAGYNCSWWNNGGGSGWQTTDAEEAVVRVRLREDDDGVLRVFVKEVGGSCFLTLGNRQVTDLLRDRWDEVELEQLGSDGVAVVDADEVTTLLRLSLSDDLKWEFDRKLGADYAQRFQRALLHVRFGPEEALRDQRKKFGWAW